MMKRAVVEANYHDAGAELSARIAPGMMVDVDSCIPGSKKLSYADVFPARCFEDVEDRTLIGSLSEDFKED